MHHTPSLLQLPGSCLQLSQQEGVQGRKPVEELCTSDSSSSRLPLQVASTTTWGAEHWQRGPEHRGGGMGGHQGRGGGFGAAVGAPSACHHNLPVQHSNHKAVYVQHCLHQGHELPQHGWHTEIQPLTESMLVNQSPAKCSGVVSSVLWVET